MNTDPSIHTAVRILNEAFAADPQCLDNLFKRSWGCNQTLADHPTIQVRQDRQNDFLVGMIGILNGVLEPMTGQRVAAKWSERDCDGHRFLLGFQVYEPASPAQ